LTPLSFANGKRTPYGLSAGVDPHVPFDGRKALSFGMREQGRYASEFYTVVKTTYVNP